MLIESLRGGRGSHRTLMVVTSRSNCAADTRVTVAGVFDDLGVKDLRTERAAITVS